MSEPSKNNAIALLILGGAIAMSGVYVAAAPFFSMSSSNNDEQVAAFFGAIITVPAGAIISFVGIIVAVIGARKLSQIR